MSEYNHNHPAGSHIHVPILTKYNFLYWQSMVIRAAEFIGGLELLKSRVPNSIHNATDLSRARFDLCQILMQTASAPSLRLFNNTDMLNMLEENPFVIYSYIVDKMHLECYKRSRNPRLCGCWKLQNADPA